MPNVGIADRLQKIAGQLRSGQWFMSTRLTILKRPCEDPAVASAFALYLARKVTYNEDKKRPRDIDEKRWRRYHQLMVRVIAAMQQVVKTPTPDKRKVLAAAVADLAEMQSTVVKVSWNSVREIEYNDAFIVELAGQCVLDMEQAGTLAYRLARAYAECYDSHYGTGLIPASAPLVEDIAAFWIDYPTSANTL